MSTIINLSKTIITKTTFLSIGSTIIEAPITKFTATTSISNNNSEISITPHLPRTYLTTPSGTSMTTIGFRRKYSTPPPLILDCGKDRIQIISASFGKGDNKICGCNNGIDNFEKTLTVCIESYQTTKIVENKLLFIFKSY